MRGFNGVVLTQTTVDAAVRKKRNNVAQVSKTVDNALSLLHVLGEEGTSTAMELAKLTGLSRTIVHRSLVTLEKQGFTRRQGSSYSLGLAILQLSDRIEGDIREAARPGLERVAEKYETTSILVVADGTEGVILDEFVSQSGPAQIRYSLGFRSSLASGGHGRAILAYSSPEIVEATLGQIDDDATRERVRASLEKIRKAGFAFSSDEVRSGVSGMAVPVLDRHGFAFASIGVVTVVGRFPEQDEVAGMLKEVSTAISTRVMR